MPTNDPELDLTQPPANPNVAKKKANGSDHPDVVPLRQRDEAILDEFERLERENILNDDDVDASAGREEVPVIEVVAKLPKFAPFRVNPETVFDMWACNDEAGMERGLVVCTKEFAPTLEQEIELRRVRFFETVDANGTVRLLYNFQPDKDGRAPNTWLASKGVALEQAKQCWITMRSRQKLGQYVYRRSARDYGEPKFTGYSRGQLIHFALRKPGLLVEDETHAFYRRAADLIDDE